MRKKRNVKVRNRISSILVPYMSQKQESVQENSADSEAPEDGSPEQIVEEESEPVLAYQKIFDVEGFHLYRIQAGAFSSKENAVKLVEELRKSGMAADYKAEGLYKVFALYTFDRDLAEKQLKEMKKHLPEDAHVSQKKYPSIGIGSPESMTYQAEIIWKQLQQFREMIENTADSIAVGEDVENLIKEQKTQITYYKQQLDKLELDIPLTECRNEMQNLYSEMLDTYSRYYDKENDYRQLALELVNNYLDFMDRLTNMY